MTQLQYEINGIKYLLFEATINKETGAIKFLNRVERYRGIIQSYNIKRSIIHGNELLFKVLIPECFALMFSNDQQ